MAGYNRAIESLRLIALVERGMIAAHAVESPRPKSLPLTTFEKTLNFHCIKLNANGNLLRNLHLV